MKDFGLNKIFVEGKSDKLFIEAVLFKYFEIDCKQDGYKTLVVNTEGKDKLKKVDLRNQPDLVSAERIQANAKNLIIFDADYESKGGGLKKRRAEYEKVGQEAGIDFRIYLLPNDSDEGELENLIKTCFKEEFSFFDKCWQGMMGCFEKQEGLNLNLPEIKGYNYSYSDLLQFYRSKDVKNEYLDEGLWTLNTDTNKDLKRLVDFIEQNFFED